MNLKKMNLIFSTSENFVNQLLSLSIEDIDFINHKKELQYQVAKYIEKFGEMKLFLKFSERKI